MSGREGSLCYHSEVETVASKKGNVYVTPSISPLVPVGLRASSMPWECTSEDSSPISDPLVLGDLRKGELYQESEVGLFNLDDEYITESKSEEGASCDVELVDFFTPGRPIKLVDYDDSLESIELGVPDISYG